jgi:hypothetical protein
MVVLLGARPGGQRRPVINKLSDLGRRFERSFAGEAVISGVVTLVVLIGVVWNLPDSGIKRSMTPTLRPIASAAGLEQSWRMYAPEPISGLEGMQVRVRMADGSERVWSWDRGDRVIGPFAWYHWQKLKEQAIREPGSRAGIAHWVVRELTTDAERPVRVQMFFRNELLPPPGNDGPKTVTMNTIYDEALNGRP